MAHSHNHIRMLSAQEIWREQGMGAWLGGAEGRFFVRDTGLAPTKNIIAHRDLKSNRNSSK